MRTPSPTTEPKPARALPRRQRRHKRRRKENGFKRVAMLWVGWGFILLGIVGTFLPILQGFLFFAIGLVILSRRSPRIRLLILRLGRRYPKFRKGLEKGRTEAKKLGRRFKSWWRPGAKAR